MKIRSHAGGIFLLVPLAAWGLAGCATDAERRFQTHVNFLADDALEGRGVGSHGLRRAAEYIASQFERLGLEPGGTAGNYYQSFPMAVGKTITRNARLRIDGVTADLVLGRDFTPYSFSSNEAFDGEIAFCGYGIVAPDRQHDDFIHLDLKGRVALVFIGEPPSWANGPGNATPHAMLRNKVYNAKDRDAAAILFISRVSTEDGAPDELPEFDEGASDQYGLPAFHIRRSVAAELLGAAGLPSLEELQKQLDGGALASKVLTARRAAGQAGLHTESVVTWNVIGVLPAEDPGAKECVVIGAHYDHLGVRKPLMRRFRKGKLVRDAVTPQIHNGADDNASGVSGLLEIARTFAENPAKRKRNIVFVAFSGEEAGLHGSKQYVQKPPAACPLDATVAMLNMDMIGRMPRGGRNVQVFGIDTGEGFEQIVRTCAEQVDLEVQPGLGAGGRSDHAPFVNGKIPSLHFFTGHHQDYHKPTDDSGKINARGGARVARLVHEVASRLANGEDRLAFVPPKRVGAATSGGPTTFRVVMGLAPNYVEDGKPGMLVDSVSREGPADLAGMRGGDRIVRIEDKPVANIYDYMAATRNNKPGETVSVVVLRDGREVALRVTLAPAR